MIAIGGRDQKKMTNGVVLLLANRSKATPPAVSEDLARKLSTACPQMIAEESSTIPGKALKNVSMAKTTTQRSKQGRQKSNQKTDHTGNYHQKPKSTDATL